MFPSLREAASVARLVLPLASILALSACAGSGRQAWDGRRGYDGMGDYGYGPSSRSAGRSSRPVPLRAAYPVPGPPHDPWGPHVGAAASRFGVPQSWIRAVMRQESGGRQTGPDGRPITSSAGAMGLMQVMPATYDGLRQRYSLGPDPFEPRDNIMAGTAYLREMQARFGAPAFLAAYNAGPERVSSYLAGSAMLPDETVSYVASVGPRIGMAASFGPGGYGQAGALHQVAASYPDGSPDAAYAGGGMTGAEYFGLRR